MNKHKKEVSKLSKKAPRCKTKRSLRHGALSAAFTVLFIAAVVVVNVIVWVVSDRVSTSADLTADEIYLLDEITETYLLDSLSADVEITVLNSEKEFENQDIAYKQVSEILKKMAMESSHVKLRFLNIDQNPNFVSKFKDETLAANYIVFECENTSRHRIISPYDYFTFNQGYLQYFNEYVVESSNIEQEAVSAMMYTTSERLIRVAFTEGYRESEGSAALKQLLSANGYEVEALPLNTTPEISSEIDFIVVFAPLIDIDKEQLAKLDKFLDNNGEFGKNVIYFASTQQPKTPNIDEFLSDWGLAVGYDAVGQSDESYLLSAATSYAHLQQICDTDYTKSVYGSRLLTFGAEHRPVYATKGSSNERTVLMKTFDGAFLYPLDEEAAKEFVYDNAEFGEFNDVIVSQKSGSRVCAVGSELLSSSAVMSYGNSNNAEFFVGMWDYISGREQGMTIKAKSLVPAVFDMSLKTANALAVVLCVIVPVCVIVLGLVIWLRRRHR